MKHITLSYLAAAFAAMATISCSNDITEQSATKSTSMVPMTFTATQEGSDITRTAISGTNINWQSSDKVAVWDGTQINQFTIATGAETTKATFSGSVTSGSTSFVALYPYSAINEDYENYVFADLDGYGIDMMTIPTKQTATKDSYDPSAALMTATATSTNPSFAFKNVCAFLKLTTDKEYKEIDVSVTDGALAGTGYITNYGENPVFNLYGEAFNFTPSKTVSLTSSSGTFAAGTYYIAVAPGTITGLTVECVGSTGYCEKTSSKTFTLERSNSYDLGSTSTSSWTSHTFTAGFSVSDSKKVLFTKGNLYWNGSAFAFESSQTAYPATWSTSHVGHFWWAHSDDYNSGNADYMPYAANYAYSGNLVPTNKSWCDVSNPLTVNGTSGYYVLTSDEWNYLLGTTPVRKGRSRYGVTVGGVANCLIIAPDKFTGTIKDSYDSASDLDADGLICLPLAGKRSSGTPTVVDKAGSEGYYATASTQGDYSGVYQFYFSSGSGEMGRINRSGGTAAQAYRLVYTYTGE